MKKFILHIVLFLICILATILAVFLSADGNSDSFYLKLSSEKQKNLILGTSKAAQGLQPKFLKNIINREFYNFAFSIYASPFGNTYLKSIKAKIDRSSKDQLFILTIDPWSIGSLTTDPNNSLIFREKKAVLEKIKSVSQSPNYDYLINYFEGNYYTVLLKNSPAFLHNDGWLEVSLNDDIKAVEKRTKFTINDYKEKVKNYRISSVRIASLVQTIAFLQEFGNVYMVRLPIHKDLMAIESTLTSEFDAIIQPAIQSANGYLDLTYSNEMYDYTDGVHLNKNSGKEVTKVIANWILKTTNNLRVMTIPNFKSKLQNTATEIEFTETMSAVEDNYNFTPTTFTNGNLKNVAGQNSGSCKLFAFAVDQKLTKEETLACFGQFYFEEVLNDPNGTGHQNIRNFIETGFEGLKFEGVALIRK